MSLETLKQYIEEDRLIRNNWFGTDEQGRQTACLYAALVGNDRPPECPSSVMPRWLAYLTPWIDDAGSAEKWPAMVRRYADLAGRWHVLTEEQWHRAEYKFRKECVLESMKHTTNEVVLAACRTVIALLDREIAGDSPTKDEWTVAAAAAWAAEAAAQRRARAAAEAAAWAAEAAARAEAAWTAWAAWAAAADRLTEKLFEILEGEIGGKK